VGNSEDSNDEGSEEGDILGRLVNRQRPVSISPRVTPSPRLGESSAQGARMVPPQPAPVRSRSNASMERPGTAGSLLASAKQLPAWARYVPALLICELLDNLAHVAYTALSPGISIARREGEEVLLSPKCPDTEMKTQQSTKSDINKAMIQCR
jgi:hypothetical protein